MLLVSKLIKVIKTIGPFSVVIFLYGLYITDWSMATAIATVNGILGGVIITRSIFIFTYNENE